MRGGAGRAGRINDRIRWRARQELDAAGSQIEKEIIPANAHVRAVVLLLVLVLVLAIGTLDLPARSFFIQVNEFKFGNTRGFF